MVVFTDISNGERYICVHTGNGEVPPAFWLVVAGSRLLGVVVEYYSMFVRSGRGGDMSDNSACTSTGTVARMSVCVEEEAEDAEPLHKPTRSPHNLP